jgi:centrosomal CEP192-like protein
VTFSGFSGFAAGDNLGHVFSCSTASAVCSDISSNLPNMPVNDIVIDPAIATTLYVATDLGVFQSTNGGGSWSTFSNGLPNVAVLGLRMHAASRTLRAATHGRSAWDILVPLGSMAPAVSLSAMAVGFGNQRVGTTSAAQTVTLTNSGNATLTISSIAITGANSGDFSQTNTCPVSPSTLVSGANCLISLTFQPTGTGNRAASVTITDNASGSPHSVTLTGTGTAPAVTLAPTSLNFAGQLVTTASAAQAITLTNSGSAPLTISSIALSGTNSGDFAETNTCPASSSSLAAGANCMISVTFTPTATGTRAASVTVTDNVSGSPQSVSLTGTGTDYSLAAATGANCPASANCSTSATITAGQTATYDLQASPVSGFNGTVSFTCSGAPSPSTCAVSPASVPPNGSSSYAFVVTVGNTTNALVPALPVFLGNPWMPWMRFLVSLLSMILAGLLVRRFFATARPVRILVPVAAAVLFSLVYASGCGGGGGPVVKPPTNATLTITGSSGTVNRTLNLSLTVNH